MARRNQNAKARKDNGATVGYEAQLWQMADALRGSMDAAEYKHVVLGHGIFWVPPEARWGHLKAQGARCTKSGAARAPRR